MADAAYLLLTKSFSETQTSNFFIDEEVLLASGITEFDHYAVEQDTPLMQDLFIGDPKQPLRFVGEKK
jgi:citronellol/citronellal dehydrogenase